VQEVKASKLVQKIAELTETIVFDPNTMMPGAQHPSLNYNAMVLSLSLFLSCLHPCPPSSPLARGGAVTAGGLGQHDSNGPDLSERLGRVRVPPPTPRTKWTRRVPHPVLIGHAASLSQVDDDDDDEALPPPPNLNLAGAKAKAPGRARPSAMWMLEKRGQV
jgi:hypothetical protein